MTQEEIKLNVQAQYAAMRTAEQTLKELRLLCQHPNTENGLYSWRVGSINPAIICSDCGTCIKVLVDGTILAVETPPQDGHILPSEDDEILSANL